MNKKISESDLKIYLNLLYKIISFGALIVLSIAIIYILIKLPLNEIKSALTYYYSETLVIEGKYEHPVNFVSESGVKISLPAIEIVANPLVMLSKQQFNWVAIKGIFIGYITFKIFCVAFFLWIYFKRKKAYLKT